MTMFFVFLAQDESIQHVLFVLASLCFTLSENGKYLRDVTKLRPV